MGCGKVGCSIDIWSKFLYLTQGFLLAAIGIVGVIKCTCADTECVRLKERYILISCFACFHLISSLIYITRCNTKNKKSKTFIAYFLWGCVLSGLASYQVVQLYEYKMAFTLEVLFTMIMTILFDILMIILNTFHIVKMCWNVGRDKLQEIQVEV